ncbi:peptide chain release factor N(5)-glutamine methyltransferase [Ranunculus cassubicifolius]
MILTSFPRTIRYSTILPSSFLFKHKNPSPRNFCVTQPNTSPSSISAKPLQLPLFLKPPVYSAPLSELQRFQNWARTLSLSIGSKFLDSDNGPEPELLCKELDWFLEDAIDEDNDKALTSLGPPENERVVRLRVQMDELYVLWKQRIEERRPFQYIVGNEHWRDLVLSVQEGVLIPRPETELIIDTVEEFLLKDKKMKEGLWVDLGTGSGALAIGIGRILGIEGRVVATDISPIAASVATFNVQRYGLQDKVEIRVGSWFEPLGDVRGKVAGLVSNPPYIPSEDIPGLQAEVGKHEPKLALDGGSNGMDDLLHLCQGAALVLNPGGFFMFETNGEKQSMFLADFMNIKMEGSFQNVKVLSDFAGIQRFVSGFRK